MIELVRNHPRMCRLTGHRVPLSVPRTDPRPTECPRCHRQTVWTFDRQIRRWFRQWA